MAGGTFPTTVPAYPSISSAEVLGTMGGGVGHRQTHVNEETDITALATKVGAGASTPAEGKGLIGTASGTAWAGTMAQLAKTTLGSASATVDFASISQAYSALRIQVFARTTAAATFEMVQMRFGSAGSPDTGNNYDTQGIYASNTTATGENYSAVSYAGTGYAAANTAPSGEASGFDIFIPAYATTTFNKRWSAIGGYRTGTTSTTHFAQNYSGDWRNTAAINFIRLFVSSTFATGSVFVLWGIL